MGYPEGGKGQQKEVWSRVRKEDWMENPVCLTLREACENIEKRLALMAIIVTDAEARCETMKHNISGDARDGAKDAATLLRQAANAELAECRAGGNR